MKIVKLNSKQFDLFTENHRYRNYYQTSMYSNVMSKFGYKTQYLGVVNENNSLIGAALILYRTIFMKYKIAYAPRGFLFNYENKQKVYELTEQLKKVLGKSGFMLLRIDPYIPLTVRDANGAIMNFNNMGNTIIENIKDAGFKYKGKNLYFETEKPRWEALITLQKNAEEIFAKLDKRTRNKIRKATNSGIIVSRDKSQGITNLFKFIEQRDKKPLSFYQEMVKQFSENIDIYYAKIKTETFLINSRRNYEKEQEYNDELAEKIQNMELNDPDRNTYINKKIQSDKSITSYKANLLKATELLKQKPDGITIAGAMVIRYDNAAYIFVEGINETYSNLNAGYLLKWQMINDYIQEGFKYINLNAIVGEFEKKNKYSGLNEVKLGFNSTVTEYIGEFDIVLNNFAYNLYQKMNKRS